MIKCFQWIHSATCNCWWHYGIRGGSNIFSLSIFIGIWVFLGRFCFRFFFLFICVDCWTVVAFAVLIELSFSFSGFLFPSSYKLRASHSGLLYLSKRTRGKGWQEKELVAFETENYLEENFRILPQKIWITVGPLLISNEEKGENKTWWYQLTITDFV